MARPVVLVADPDPEARKAIREACEADEYAVLEAASGAEAERLLGERTVDAVWFDPRTPGLRQESLVGSAARLPATTVVVAVVGSGDDAGALLRSGAFETAAKPLGRGRLDDLVFRVRRQHEILAALHGLRERLGEREGYQGLVGHSPSIERLRERLAQLAHDDVVVGFCGETGTGKKLAARTLHGRATPAGAPFIPIHCSSLHAASWDAHWFGGADQAGLLRQARGGTIYLDELGDLAPELQTRLLATLGRGAPAERPGIERRFRLSWSTARDPALAEPLSAALGGVRLHLPALRERSEDVALLARHFVDAIGEINRLPPMRLSPEALSLLERYHWPGNVQELRNAMELAVILARDEIIRPTDLPDRIREWETLHRASGEGRGSALKGFREAKRAVVEQFECAYLGELLDRHRGNVTLAAQQAGMLRSALQRLLRKHRMRSSEFRRSRYGVAPQPR
jgi:DNA-binding NtrC family response regulator